MVSKRCRYCEMIRGYNQKHPRRQARHALESSHPRCDIHWRFTCSVCGRARHFNGVSFCPRESEFYCIGCAPEHRAVRRRFWDWSYYFKFKCPWHDEWHAALDYLEFEGHHPWQTSPGMRRGRTGLSRKKYIEELWDLRVTPLENIEDDDVRKGWDDVAEWWVSRYNPKGDLNREWLVDPVLLRFLGKVEGLRILDAGCGGGYLSRILARRGAAVDGIDLSPKLIETATMMEKRDPSGAKFRKGNLANMRTFRSGTFDKVVSNIVLQDVLKLDKAVKEIYRVMKPGGSFVFSITHPAFERPPSKWLREPEDTERTEEWLYLMTYDYLGRVATYWGQPGLPMVVGFHRPLRDYFEALTKAGFLVSRLEEPMPTKKALEKHYRHFSDGKMIPLFMVVEAVKPG